MDTNEVIITAIFVICVAVIVLINDLLTDRFWTWVQRRAVNRRNRRDLFHDIFDDEDEDAVL